MSNTTYEEFYRKVLLRFEDMEGRVLIAAKEAINTAHKAIARVQDFDELKVLDTTNALTAPSTKSYHLIDDWNLTRPKDIFTLRYMDEGSSRKLTRLTTRELDEKIPYVEGMGERRPKWYLRRGNKIELIPIPEEAKSMYIYYSQWPLPLSADSDETSYEDLDDIIIALSAEITSAILENAYTDWNIRAKAYLNSAITDHMSRPDMNWVARPFSTSQGLTGEPWKDPFVKQYS